MDHRPLISLVVARSKNGVIGCDNRLPWNVPSDLKRFKEITFRHPIVIGRNTFDLIGRAIPGRTNIVVSRDTAVCHGEKFNGVELYDSLDRAIVRAEDVCRQTGRDEIMVIGGGEVFNALLSRADKVYLTEINVDIRDADAVYFSADFGGWIKSQSIVVFEAGDQFSSEFTVYQKEALSWKVGPEPIPRIAAE